MPARLNLTRQIFTRLTVIARAPNKGSSNVGFIGNNLVDSPSPLWNVPYKLWSLWDMIQYPVRDLCLWLISLTSLTSRLERHGTENRSSKLSELSEKSLVEGIKTTLTEIGEILGQCELEQSLARLKRTQLALASNPLISRFSHDLGTLYETISDELVLRVFMFVPGNKADYYTSPEKQFPKSWGIFPTAQNDMRSACQCYAADQNSACVFHCMGIMQVGLVVLAKKRLNITVDIYVDTWNDIIQKIESAVKNMRVKANQATSTKIKSNWKKVEPFYGETISDVRAVKDAWRNPSAHFRRQYDELEAKKVLSKVSDFMENLTRLFPRK